MCRVMAYILYTIRIHEDYVYNIFIHLDIFTVIFIVDCSYVRND